MKYLAVVNGKSVLRYNKIESLIKALIKAFMAILVRANVKMSLLSKTLY